MKNNQLHRALRFAAQPAAVAIFGVIGLGVGVIAVQRSSDISASTASKPSYDLAELSRLQIGQQAVTERLTAVEATHAGTQANFTNVETRLLALETKITSLEAEVIKLRADIFAGTKNTSLPNAKKKINKRATNGR